MNGPAAVAPLQGSARVLGTLALSLAIFMNVLDTSIANVSIPAISGDLGVSPDQGTWVITSFGVANAISVPLTGWLTRRFGQVRLFTLSIFLFVIASFLCGLAPSIGWLIFFRVIQGAVAGPMIPLSQSLLMSSYPPAKQSTALGLWSLTSLTAPVAGPLLGGWITDNISWPWIFYINVPIGLFACTLTWILYRRRETPTLRVPIDAIGLVLLVTWVGALQIMLDKGKDLDWFSSPQIIMLALTAVVAFVYFLIWEIHHRHPIVDLSLFKLRNFTVGTLCMLLAYGVFFGNLVLLPLWLQQYLGYTATEAGFVLAPVGALAVIVTPIVAKLTNRVDLRVIVTVSFTIFATVMMMRARFDTDVDVQDLDDPDPDSGCGHGQLLRAAGDLECVGPGARAHSQCLGAVQLRAHHLRFLRYLDLHDSVGPARHRASPAAGRAPDGRQSGRGRRTVRTSVQRAQRAAERRGAEPAGRHPGLHALGG